MVGDRGCRREREHTSQRLAYFAAVSWALEHALPQKACGRFLGRWRQSCVRRINDQSTTGYLGRLLHTRYFQGRLSALSFLRLLGLYETWTVLRS